MLNIIDISGWQKGLDLATLFAKNPDLDGVVIKATGGTCIYQGDTFKPWADWCIANNKPFGFYHFLDDDLRNSSGKAEAEFFVSKTRDYFGKGIPAADYEGQAKKMGTRYLKEFLDTVYALTGIKPVLYCSLSVAAQKNMQDIANAGYRLWFAQYANYNPMYGFTTRPWQSGSIWPFPGAIMQQYTSQMYLNGWRSHLDANLFYADRPDWDSIVNVTPVFPPSAAEKTLDDWAREIIDGRYGNGAANRKKGLATAKCPYSYEEVQKRVNEILTAKPKKTEDYITTLAKECIAGKHGNGVARRIKITALGYDYNAVQKRVNELLSGR